jgi:hypothetical protein
MIRRQEFVIRDSLIYNNKPMLYFHEIFWGHHTSYCEVFFGLPPF